MSEFGDRVSELGRRMGVTAISRTALLGIGALCVLATLGVLWRFGVPGGSGESFEIGSTETTAVADSPGPDDPDDAPAAEVVVHVAGAVARPGVVTLAAGSRVADALEAAGGLVGDAAPEVVNLARVLSDGEQVYLPTRTEVDDAGGVAVGLPARGEAGNAEDGTVRVNAADAAELETLPGIGPKSASAIIEEREANGPFSSADDLLRVAGIGPKKLEAIKDLISLE